LRRVLFAIELTSPIASRRLRDVQRRCGLDADIIMMDSLDGVRTDRTRAPNDLVEVIGASAERHGGVVFAGR